MLNLENKKWKDFKIDSLFSVDKGIYIKESNIKKGKIPYITAKATNNGLNCFIGNSNLFEGNNITVEKVKLSAFYQPSKYYCSHDVSVLSNSKLNKENSLFIATMIGRQGSKYSYGRQAQMNVVKKQKILLPVNEKSEPDYEYMENYTKSTMDRKVKIYKKYIQNVLSGLEYKEIEPLENKEWKEFVIGEVFNVLNSKPYHKKDLKISNNYKNSIPYVSRTNRNNGVEEIIQKEDSFKINKKNTIAFGAENATFFLQPFEYITGNKIYTINHKQINKFNGLFIQQALNTSIKDCGFSYGQGLTGTRAKRRNVLLPINENNDPDFEYMEQYMKNLMYKKIKQYLNYKNKEA